MRQLRRVMNLWRMHIQNFMIFHQQDYVFLRCMDQQEDLIWHILDLQISLEKVRQLKYLIMVTVSEILHI